MKSSQHTVKKLFMLATSCTLALTLFGCNHSTSTGKVARDGSTKTPVNYQSWPKFVSTIDKSSGHVREIYINKTGYKTQRGQAFPAGTVSVMEIYNAKKNTSGAVIKDSNGKLIKGALAKIFIMEKGTGWGKQQPSGVTVTGDWIYSAYKPDGVTPATSGFSKCRGCHIPLADKDYVARYDEHFDFKAKQ